MIIDTVKKFCLNYNIKNCSILLAISGGRDSMTLLHSMLELRDQLHLDLGVAYVNHHLRDDSDEEEAFVTKNISSLSNVKFYKHIVDKNYWSTNNQSIEEKARKIRYDFFKNICQNHNYQFIATAHHLDDKIETFFINLLRGGGVETLCSIAQKNDNIIRPMLQVSRNEINNYINENKIDFIDDYTNNENNYLRNRIRHNILPQLAEITPHYQKSFTHIFDFLEEEVQTIDFYTFQAIHSVITSSNQNEFILNRIEFDKLPIAIRKNIIKFIIEKLNFPTNINLALLNTLTMKYPQRINFTKGKLNAISKSKILRIEIK